MTTIQDKWDNERALNEYKNASSEDLKEFILWLGYNEFKCTGSGNWYRDVPPNRRDITGWVEGLYRKFKAGILPIGPTYEIFA